jgi:WS/DGAT/MGAT family acyltransferase
MLRQQPDPPAETSLMVSIGPNRHLAFVDVPLARLKAIRSRLGGAVNDVVLTAVVGGLRALFEQRGEMPLPDYLRVLVPVNMRTLSEEHSIKMNVSFFAINLPLAGADLLGRYQGTVQTTQMLKQSRRAATDQTLVDFAAMIPPVLQRALTRYVHPLGRYDVMVTNVPGSQGNVTFMGAPIHRVLPAVPPTTGHALNVVVCSYSGTVTLGIHADRDAVPDLDVVRAGIERALDQLAHTTEENRHRGPSG